MAITKSGAYGITLEKCFIDTAGQSMEAETHKGLLVTDTYTPNYDTHDFRDDVTNEVSGTNYTAGGNTVTTTVITLAAPAAESLKLDYDDPQWPNSTISAAMAHVFYFNVGSAATDQLVLLQDFVTAATTSAGLLLVQIHADGALNLDYA